MRLLAQNKISSSFMVIFFLTFFNVSFLVSAEKFSYLCIVKNKAIFLHKKISISSFECIYIIHSNRESRKTRLQQSDTQR